MIFWNLLDGEPTRNKPFFGPSESLRGGTLGTHPRHFLERSGKTKTGAVVRHFFNSSKLFWQY
jgi:hypothetical protein